MTPSGIEPATFRLVAQRLNQLRHAITVYSNNNFKNKPLKLRNKKFPKQQLRKDSNLTDRRGLVVRTILTARIKNSDASTKSFTRPAYSVSRKSGKGINEGEFVEK
jgi:hypothetical protein